MNNLRISILCASLIACTGTDYEEKSVPDKGDTPAEDLTPANTAGGEDNTFEHPNTQVDIWELMERLKDEGPLRYSSRVHSCRKIKYRSIGRLLDWVRRWGTP